MESKVAYLGPHGTFSEEAVRFFFANQNIQTSPLPSIPDVLDAAEKGQVQFAVVPIENSIEGSVTSTIDWLIHKVNLKIHGELTLPIHHHLLATTSIPLHKIEKVYSHTQALAQCRQFLHQHLPHAQIEYISSTAEAVRFIADHPCKPWAAIGSRLAQSVYKVNCLHSNIQDYVNNYTRFVLVSAEEKAPELLRQAEKFKTTLLVMHPSDSPVALHKVLTTFAERNINLSRIESRPTKKGMGKYQFIFDVAQSHENFSLITAMAKVESQGYKVRWFGTYPSYVLS